VYDSVSGHASSKDRDFKYDRSTNHQERSGKNKHPVEFSSPCSSEQIQQKKVARDSYGRKQNSFNPGKALKLALQEPGQVYDDPPDVVQF
jgi:hypothetical protein